MSIPTTYEQALEIAIRKTVDRVAHHVRHSGMTKDQALQYVKENESTFGPKSWQRVVALA